MTSTVLLLNLMFLTAQLVLIVGDKAISQHPNIMWQREHSFAPEAIDTVQKQVNPFK
jgi:hypothetical protein